MALFMGEEKKNGKWGGGAGIVEREGEEDVNRKNGEASEWSEGG